MRTVKMLSLAALASILAGCSMLPHKPGTGMITTKPFQATYETEGKGMLAMNASAAHSKTHVTSDGAGHIRQDSFWSGSYDAGPAKHLSIRDGLKMLTSGQMPTTVEIIDLNGKQRTLWVNGFGFYTRQGIDPASPIIKMGSRQAPDPVLMAIHLAPADSKTATALGAKSINGRACHGWKDGDNEMWIDDEYGIAVKASGGMMDSTLVDISAQAPDPAVFSPPKDYSLREPKAPPAESAPNQ